jgi:hypothetical protein
MASQPSADRPRRRNGARALVALASVLAFLAVFAVWLDRQLLDTDNWTSASSQMLENPAIRDQTAAFLTDQLYANVDVEGEIRDALPSRAQALAGPAAGFLRDRVDLRARQALARPDVQELWENANRAAHEQLLNVLDGGGGVVSTTNGAVVLDLKALLVELEKRSGIGGKAAGALPPSAAQITILKSDQLSTAQDVANLVDGLPIVLVALSLACFGGALLLSPGYRRRAVRGYGLGLMAAGLGALAVSAWIGSMLVDSLSKTASTEPAIRGVWDIYDTLLIQAATATVGYGAVTVFGAWLVGPTSWAVAIRRASAPYLRQPLIAYGVLAAIVLVTIVWWAPTPATRNPVTAVLLAALLAVGLEGLRRQTAREYPRVAVTQAPPYAPDGEPSKPKTVA